MMAERSELRQGVRPPHDPSTRCGPPVSASPPQQQDEGNHSLQNGGTGGAKEINGLGRCRLDRSYR
jgi:hypothetical protein